VHPGDKHYRNMAVRLSDLAVTETVIRGVTFENCALLGPAVLVLLGASEITGCSLEGDPDGVFWEIPPERGQVIGAIGLQDCHVVGCTFRFVGFGVPSGLLPQFRAGFGLG